MPASHEEVAIQREQEIRVPPREEQLTLEKRPVVHEEVGVGNQAVTETQRVSDTVRREEARIEHTDDLDCEHPHEHDTQPGSTEP